MCNKNSIKIEFEDMKCLLKSIFLSVAVMMCFMSAQTARCQSEGIQAVKVKQSGKDVYYDLEGKEVPNPQKGKIYIHGGKKILMK